jgi:hypothetical protein
VAVAAVTLRADSVAAMAAGATRAGLEEAAVALAFARPAAAAPLSLELLRHGSTSPARIPAPVCGTAGDGVARSDYWARNGLTGGLEFFLID